MSSHPLRVARRLFIQSAVPLLLAFAYAAWDYVSVPAVARTPSSFVKSLGIAFFLVMWFTGQWLRAAKQISDDVQLSGIKADVEEIKAAVRQRDQKELSTAREVPVSDPVARTLLSEAESAMSAGLHRSALVTAAVSFEHALRRFAARSKIAEAPRLPIPRLILSLRGALGPAVSDDLAGLWKVRNVVVHTPDSEYSDRQVAERVYDGFRWAIVYLSDFLIPDQAPPDGAEEDELTALRSKVANLNAKLEEVFRVTDVRALRLEAERDQLREEASRERSDRELEDRFRRYEDKSHRGGL